jgi:crotonobetainyl-CoA:carnitine CoA-transferase CaiB-like acyl-CoA transferase
MVAAGNDNLFPRLAHILERPDWLQDERFLDNVARVKNRAALIPLIQNIFVTRPSETWLQMLDAGGVPASPLQTVDQVVNDPQTAALGIIQRVPDLEMQLLGLPLSFNGARPPLRRRAPEPGEHNHQILKPHV